VLGLAVPPTLLADEFILLLGGAAAAWPTFEVFFLRNVNF